MQAQVDEGRAELVFGRLLAALRRNQYPYNIAQLPQDLVPEKMRSDQLKHAQFLFYVCHYMRGAIRSETAIQQLLALWRQEPWLFAPDEVTRRVNESGTIAEYLRKALDYHTDQIAQFWLENSRRLRDSWRSDPREIFANVSDGNDARDILINRENPRAGTKPRQDLFKHGSGFLGFQGKMASMLTYFLMEAKLIAPFPMAPAVDFHLLRVMLATGVLRVDAETVARGIRYDQIQPLGQALLERYCHKKRVSMVEIGDALWALSTTLCRKAPGNASINRSKERRPRRERARPSPLVLDPGNQEHRERYWVSCGNCPAAKYCSANVPSGPYYESGVLLLHGRLILPEPAPGLFGALPLRATKRALFVEGELAAQEIEQFLLFET
jgi:hypothetical protein